MPSMFSDDGRFLGTGPTARILCKCGGVAEVDRSVLGMKRGLGKIVECRRCRNLRIAKEREELDQEFNGMLEGEER